MPHKLEGKLLVTNKINVFEKTEIGLSSSLTVTGFSFHRRVCVAAVFDHAICPVMHLSSNRQDRSYTTPANSAPYFSLTATRACTALPLPLFSIKTLDGSHSVLFTPSTLNQGTSWLFLGTGW